ncbi:hypothetical protein [Gordonia sp. (in: high G+C Gram-positive bacteria)]|uniref:hypothetical protein n=1 Tax=Gordonia sp. (in: high G+C Gram-positive bacteria) TaxID=84139 RepID=UPI0033412E34
MIFTDLAAVTLRNRVDGAVAWLADIVDLAGFVRVLEPVRRVCPGVATHQAASRRIGTEAPDFRRKTLAAFCDE